MPTLDRITIHPVKSLDGVDVDDAVVLAAGGLANDRRWQLVDLDGRVVNAKRTPRFHAIRAGFDLQPAVDGGSGTEPNLVTLSIDDGAVRAGAVPGVERLAALAADTFPLVPGPRGPCDWLSEALGVAVLLMERPGGGFPDDRESPGPTLVSTATLEAVARWFALGLDEIRRRFRANLEIGGCDAFWEDTLASPARPELAPSLVDLPADTAADPFADLPPPEPLEFAIGTAWFRATNVCRRCVVPTRDVRTGGQTPHFRDAFEAWRRRTLRPDVDASAWGTLYRVALNTVAVGPGQVFRGDSLSRGGAPG